MKKILLFYVAVVFTVVTSFAQTFTSGGLSFEVSNASNLEATVRGRARGFAREITIPETVTLNDGTTYTVTSIGNDAFRNNALTSVVIPASVTGIGNDAFSFNALTSVVIPEGVISIGEEAFSFNDLTSVDIPASVTSIGEEAFLFNALTSIVIPESVTSIGGQAFRGNNLISVVIPTSITSIGLGAFLDNLLTSLVISEGTIESIGEFAFAFSGNPSLTSITSLSTNPVNINSGDPFSVDLYILDRSDVILNIPAGTREAYEANGWTGFNIVEIFDFEGFTFEIVSETEVVVTGRAEGNTDTEITIPETATFNNITYTVTSIGVGAFAGNDLASVDIPASVTSIGEAAFVFNSLTSVILLSTNPVNINSEDPFSNNLAVLDRSGVALNIPAGTREAYEANGWTGFNIVEIFDFEVFDFEGFTFEVVSETAVVVTGRAEGNTATEITIPETATLNGTTYTVTSIGNDAFRNNDLASVVTPTSVTSIGEEAFSFNDLTSVVIPASITSIGRGAFSNNLLTSLVISEGIESIGEFAFAQNALEFVVIPDSVTSIGSFAFGESPAFTSNNALTLITSLSINPADINNIAPFFGLDRADITLNIPAGTREAYKANGWTGFNIVERDVSFIDQGFTFEVVSETEVVVTGRAEGNTDTEITIPEATTFNGRTYIVTSIGEFAFTANDLITSVVIPDSVTSIGEFAFSETFLASVVISNGVTSIGNDAFSFNPFLESVDIPASVTSIGAGAFSNSGLILITSLSINPADINNINPFTGLNRSGITLNIPVGTIEAYEANGWTGFNIVEDATLSIADTAVSLKDNFVVLTNPNSISVKSMGIATINVQELVIYAMSGKKVATSTGANISTESLVNGVYLLRVITDKGAVTKKIIK